MTAGFQTESLIRRLREEPGSITAVIVPSASGQALLDLIRYGLGLSDLEIVGRGSSPREIGARAEKLGFQEGIPILFVALDSEEGWGREEVRSFWRDLNFQRERLASGNIRTCLVMSEAMEPAFAGLAKDLWDWAIFFRLGPLLAPSPKRADPVLPLALGAEPAAVVPDSAEELGHLRQRWLDARESGLPERTVVDTYALPYFSAAVELDPEQAFEAWETFRHLPLPAFRPESNLQFARDLLSLAAAITDARRLDLMGRTLDVSSRILGSELDPEQRVTALAVASDLFQKAGRYREALEHISSCLNLLDREGLLVSREDLPEELRRRRQDLVLLLRILDSNTSDPSDRVRDLLPAKESETRGDEVRQDIATYPEDEAPPDFGRLLDLVVKSIDGPTDVISPLLGAWVLSSTSQLFGPTFEQVMRRDPVAYCRGIASLWMCWSFSVWKESLLEPLKEAWRRDDEAAAIFRSELERWVLEATEFKTTWKSTLEHLALRVFGERYDPTLISLFCRHVAQLSEGIRKGEESDRARRRSSALTELAFLFRWSFQETAIPDLLAVAEHPNSSPLEKEAARALASTLLLEGLPDSLQIETSPGFSRRRGQETARKLMAGEREIFEGLSARKFPGEFSPTISAVAGDPSVPHLTSEDLARLKEGLSELIQSGRIKQGVNTVENGIFEAWMPWVARCAPKVWWRLMEELLAHQALSEDAPWVLLGNSVLGLWSDNPAIQQGFWELLLKILQDSEKGKKLRRNGGLSALLRWLVLADDESLIKLLDALVPPKGLRSMRLDYLPVPTLLGWSMGREVFNYARSRRRASSDDNERYHWYMAEQAFVPLLPPDEALDWCKEVWTFSYRVGNLRSILIDHLIAIDSARVLDFLMTDPLVGDPGAYQGVILEHVSGRGDSARLAKDFPEFARVLSFLNRGRWFSEIGDSEGIQLWGRELIERILGDSTDLSFLDRGLSFPFNAMCDWARLEPEIFLSFAKQIESWNPTQTEYDLGPFYESLVLAWQVVAPGTSFKARESIEARSGIQWTVGEGLPMYIDLLWDPAHSEPARHRPLRIRYLSRCINDLEIGWHGLAARRHGNYEELKQVGRYLLASDRALDRQLAVSLLAWHPQAAEILEKSLTEDPSLRVREHAQWAMDVSQRDRLGLEAYKKALQAADWLHQQAQLEILRPLLLPTFTFWHDELPELDEWVEALPPKRRALWYDFRYRFTNQNMWGQVLFRDLEKYCRGEDVRYLVIGSRSGPPWMRMRELVDVSL